MNPTPGDAADRQVRSVTLTTVAYAMLFVFGAAQGMFGSFQYSRNSPIMAIGLCVVILATCLLGAWGLRSVTGAFVPALGWLLASYIMAMGKSSGTVIIANTTAGKWYLYGGTISAVAAVVISLAGWYRTQPRYPR
jgi:hypothetical protein